MKCSNSQLDSILKEVGEFGRYQRYLTLLIIFATVINFFSMVIYVFETIPVNHRCKISECDNETNEYNPNWLVYAVPFKNEKPSRCLQFQHIKNASCESDDFNNTVYETCNTYVYQTIEKSIMHDFNLHCDDNIKLLTMVGTVNGIGKLIGLPIAGFLSDRYGRKTVLICGTVTSGIFAIVRSFSTSYTFFIVFEFLESVFVAGILASAYVLGSEFVGPKKRALIATIQFSSFAIGSVILGSVAWLIQSWRVLLRVLYIFYLVIVTYYWLLPESVRWLLAKKRQEEAVKTLRKIAKVNKRTITEGALENLLNTNDSGNTNSLTLRDLFKSATLTIRCAISSFCWMSTIFVFYGLSITSTTLSGNRYFDFILTSAIEIPAHATACLIINKLGRKPCVAGALTLSSVSSIAFIVLPIDTYWIRLLIYLTSKFGITMTVSGLYIITNEMFPTSMRQTLLSICSMFGRIGNVLAPQLFLLMEIWKQFPLVLFATLTGISALLTLFLPETKGAILPDTIEQAEDIGKKDK
ncbi:hypothetical protein RN001_006729 [Aquatica leii]|uniref:Major facilitator superfamily (MFS) profile domain-containing protein n=1 Tax=Aquatica leii TaxID=1421715 RepID=A0AAN7SSB0_9COLE|nr:hypothetical protein RN001_006729 [Aquatica leii]